MQQSRLSVSSGSSVSADEHEAVIRELTRGHELTAQLRAEALRGQGQAEDTAQVILQKVSQAFTVCLSIMSSPGAAARRIRDGNVPRREMVTCTPDSDGYLWRKYGQKRITNTRFPRCYFRCRYHRERSCPATKQVQQCIHGDPPQYLVVYRNEHTCDTAAWEPEAASPGATNNPLLDLPGLARQQRGVQEEQERQALVSSLAIVLGAHSPAGSSVAFGREPQQQQQLGASASVVDPTGVGVRPRLDVDAQPLDVMDMDYDVTGGLFFGDSSYGLPDDGLPF